ncbi:nucleoside-diphosphate kinase [Salisediminibacterium halotolerans]|uniref:nucleoside-diphosphate kinase n=1 Tax=Salisediminibacterium halotolerans TaxID=517425 RepID=UPI000EB11331|nr:nucleoside-diphosphate kinase [Salisediminibacterium halotolerans]RLJ77943.1 nucleoside diphosphate kinase [Actinophytocola xinjiangensis]RPE88719.1 nucleoside diphosphate kinase [Salisediminibacterium halotolerans]TWG36920.1 nucleoside diphosphate kinase [Salisediminibacterium halotolerans]GEL08119.1 nucleoside diphosphate kinase [Salisediminibacterium halotolerans]
MEQTFVMVKPDGVQRGLTGEILTRFEKKGFTIAAAKMMMITEELAGTHYGEHKGKPFYEGLVDFITSGPVFAVVLEGENCISEARKMMGKTNPAEAAPGTIRGDFGLSVSKNLVHGSDSAESAEREISLFFNDAEILNYSKTVSKWV